jgi:outer membrane protein insertion porin family/translocation and assembly module TamA
VLVGRIRAGVLFAPKSFQPGGGEAVSYVPPDQRFYAGGPNDVRGYDGNQLGPVVYVVLDSTLSRDSIDAVPSVVTVSPIGGNRLLVGNLELRLPSPVLRTLTRLAIFVDAGTVWETGFDRSSSIGIRVTPGAGIRFVTPLGPARIDVAYNPYSFPPGDLFQSRSDGSLGLLERNYIKPGGSGFTVHFAVGQAF